MGASVLALSTAPLAPTAWHPAVYLALVAGLLLLRAAIPATSERRLFARELCLLLPAVLLYFLVRGLMQTRDADAVAHANAIIHLERTLGIFVEDDLQRTLIQHPTAVTIANWVYIWAHWPVIAVTAAWMWSRHRAGYRTLRNAILISGGLGLVIFALYPVAPPRLMPDWDFVDTVMERSRSYRVLQPPALTNLYAALPSLHFGWNLLVGITIVRYARAPLARAFGVLIPIAMFLAIVLTANHYILDGIAGGALALIGYVLAQALDRRAARHADHRASIATARPKVGAVRGAGA